MASINFRLTSTQTALALVLPESLHPEVNSLRSIYDKSYTKWEPHINILYPFVEPTALHEAVAFLRGCLRDDQQDGLKINIDQVGVFKHRKNATVFLKPDPDSGESLCRLRSRFVAALGCKETEGTHDGTYRPHLSIGQSSLTADSIAKLVEKTQKLVNMSWNQSTLVVLKRSTSGKMEEVDRLQLGENEDSPDEKQSSTYQGWRPCFVFDLQTGWNEALNTPTQDLSHQKESFEVSISTYNVMAEPNGPSFMSRLPLIIDAISTTPAPQESVRVLCLQEINDESLPLLLSHPVIRALYPYSSHSKTSLLPSDRNLVTLASNPFSCFTVQFPERHKSSLVIVFTERPLLVANVHLTSALTNEAVVAKKSQMEVLTEFLVRVQDKIKSNIFIAGDFNLTTSSYTIETALSQGIITKVTEESIKSVIDPNFWEDIFDHVENLVEDGGQELYEGEEGATFDRLSNPLAPYTEATIGHRPQRYDRVLYKKFDGINPQNLRNFGMPTAEGQCGSDHYGVCATFCIEESGGSPRNATTTNIAAKELKSGNISIIEDTTNVEILLEPYLPTSEDEKCREDSITALRQIFDFKDEVGQFVFAPMGSQCLGTYLNDSDIDILVIGSTTPQKFFEFAEMRLRAKEEGNEVSGIRSSISSLVPIIKFVLRGIEFDLQYCQAPALVERYYALEPTPDLLSFVFDPSVLSTVQSIAPLRSLNSYRDSAYLIRSIRDLSSYRTAHRFLSLYLKRHALYSAKFGYLGGVHLSLMLNHVVKLIEHKSANANIAPASVVRTFFAYYAEFDWAKRMVSDPFTTTKSPRSVREPVFIQAIHTPTIRPNVAASCTRLSAHTFTTEFSLASDILSKGDWNWCLRAKDAVVLDFMDTFKAFVRISVDVWDADEIGGMMVRNMIGALESKVPRLMVGLGRSKVVEARVWPAKFREKIQEEVDDPTSFKGYYLIGISAKEDNPDQKKIVTGKIITVVREFEREVRRLRELENGHIWVDMDLVPRKKLVEMNLVLDERDWGTTAVKPAVEEGINEASTTETYSQERANASSYAPLLQNTHSTSLRPAQDIISRIRWDPKLSAEEFVIGYEDRFVGVKEIELGKWKSEQTDEEFIPMHRIVWVRKVGDDEEIVWDRRKKIDLLFGSGFGRGKA